MPKLEEGNFWIRATLPTSISLEQSASTSAACAPSCAAARGPNGAACTDANRKHTKSSPSSRNSVGPTTEPTSPASHNIELFAPLKPFDKWPHGLTKEKLTEELSNELAAAFPGVVFNFSQMISDNVEEAMSRREGRELGQGLRQDLEANEKNADAIVDVMGKVKGVKDLGIFRSLGPAEREDHARPRRVRAIRLEHGRRRSGRAGGDRRPGDHAGLRRRETLRPHRALARAVSAESLEAIREITVATPDGTSVPLGQIAKISIEEGPSVIFREDGSATSPVKFSRARPRSRNQPSPKRRGERSRHDEGAPAATTRTSNGAARSTSSARRTAASSSSCRSRSFSSCSSSTAR